MKANVTKKEPQEKPLKDCRDCRYFVGCECFSGKMCDMFTEEKTVYES